MTNATTKTTETIPTTTILTKVLQYTCNVSLEKFSEDLKKIIDSEWVDADYAERKFDQMRENFAWFYCNLDEETKTRFVRCALEHYGIN